MTKAELIQALLALGYAVPESQLALATCPELRELLKEIKAARDASAPTTATSTDPTYRTSQMNKKELVDHCRQLGLELTGNETMDALKVKLRKLKMEQPATGKDRLNFGMHKTSTYEFVFRTKPEYVQWCQTMVIEGEPCPQMKRFTDWVSQQPRVRDRIPPAYAPKMESTGSRLKVEQIKMEMKGAAPSTPSSAAPFTPTGSSTSSSSNARLDRIENMMTSILAQMARNTPLPEENQDEMQPGNPSKRATM